MINILIRSKSEGCSPETISLVLSEMGKYVYVHFRDEEKFMRENGFEGLEAHRDVHGSFEDKVLEFTNQYNRGRTDLLDEVLEFLSGWLVSHIQGDDLSMVKEVLARKK
jgi:hemerythrin-like metal-binding protein